MNWIQTELKEFCFKCVANKHEQCYGKECKCLCNTYKEMGASFGYTNLNIKGL